MLWLCVVLDGGRATYSRDNGANVFRTCMMACSYLWGPIDEAKTVQLYCMLNGVDRSSSWWQRHTLRVESN